MVAVWTVACDSGSTVVTATSAGTAAEFAAQYCQILEPCCADAGLSTSGSQCRSQIVGAAASLGFSPVAGHACLDAMLAASKSGSFCTDFLGVTPQCEYLFGGQAVAPGEPCTNDSECARAASGSALCFTTGTCVQTQTGAAGQGPCVATAFRGATASVQWSGQPPVTGYTCDVADGVSCNPVTHECTALAATGHPCQADWGCVTSDYCASGSCQPRVAVGAACGNASGECVDTAYCDFFSSWICKPMLPNGSACTGASMCQSSYCNDNAKCASNSTIPLAMTCGT